MVALIPIDEDCHGRPSRPDPTRPHNPEFDGQKLVGASTGPRAYGLRTTLMQPSSLSRNVLYMPGPSSSETVWVITNDGSI